MLEHNIKRPLPDNWDIDMDWDMNCVWDMPDVSVPVQNGIEAKNITASEEPKTDQKTE